MRGTLGHKFREWLVAGMVAAATGSVCGERWAPGQESAPKAAAEKPAAGTEAQPDPFAVPDGTPEELLKYIEGLKLARPTSNSREVVLDFLKKQSEALLQAADKILAAKPKDEQAKPAVQYKVLALGMLARLGDRGAEKKLEALPAELTKAGFPSLVRDVRILLLGQRLKRTNPADKEAMAKLAAEVQTCLGEGAVNAAAAGLAIQTATAVESSGDPQLAARTYSELAKILSTSEEREVAKLVPVMRGAVRRLKLPGKLFTLKGTTIEGKPLEWKRYAGKVVLVDFFASWCPPCRAEMPNIQENYEAYHARGFDVVGVSVDQDRKALEDYLGEHPHPWTVLLDASEAAGTDQSLATYYGIIGIPQTVLVGRDGKVVTLSVRGPRLGQELEKLLGPAKEKAKTPAKNKAGGKRSGGKEKDEE
jgi:thiol-disulfide isomerase/thioredoxin